MTDFSFKPVDAAGQPVANAVAPGKRSRSSMAPTIVFDTARNVEAVLGSPGGSRIILYVVKTLIALIDWGLDAQQAVDRLIDDPGLFRIHGLGAVVNQTPWWRKRSGQ